MWAIVYLCKLDLPVNPQKLYKMKNNNYFINNTIFIMKKKDYKKPSTEVVMLQQQSIICSSPGSVSNPDPFEGGGDPLNP